LKTNSNNAQVHFDNTALKYSKNFDTKTKSGRNFEFRERRSIVSNVLSGESGVLLDCACGSGEITAEVILVGKYDAVTICDISENMLELAVKSIQKRSISINLKCIQSDIFEFLNRDDSYDVVLCLGLIAHTGRVDELLRLIRKRLSLEGKVILQSTRSEHWGTIIIRWITRYLSIKTHGYELAYYSSQELEKCILNEGNKILEKKRFCLAIPFGDRLCSYGNYMAEVIFKKIGSRFGSECIYVLGRAEG
jgi:2-polyprenyl-3-methyl-5-hydroxy-6-metoxy-1,4-benzoquinol methylase